VVFVGANFECSRENDFVAKSVRLEGKGAINRNVSINGEGKREEI
jgi:hypothetical protein